MLLSTSLPIRESIYTMEHNDTRSTNLLYSQLYIYT